MQDSPSRSNSERVYFAEGVKVYYNLTLGGQVQIATCGSEKYAQVIADRLDKLAVLEFSAINRGFTGISDELNGLATFTGDIVQACKNPNAEDAQAAVELALEALQDAGKRSPRTWPVVNPANPLVSEPSAALDPNRVAGKDVSA